MYHLSGQPNIVDLRGAYEDKHNVHLVTELCAGGELFDRIIARGATRSGSLPHSSVPSSALCTPATPWG